MKSSVTNRALVSIHAILAVSLMIFTVWASPAMAGRAETVTYRLENDAASAWKGAIPETVWQTPLDGNVVEDVRLLAPDKLLISLRKDSFQFPLSDLIMVNPGDGAVTWRFDRTKRKGEHSLVMALADIIVFRVDRGSKVYLVALSAADGNELWSVRIKSDNVRIIPVLGAGVILTIAEKKAMPLLTAFQIRDGKQTFVSSPDMIGLLHLKPTPIVYRNEIILFYDGIKKISGRSGENVWKQPGQFVGTSTPTPQIDGSDIYFVNGNRQLIRLNAVTGETELTVSLPEEIEFTNIYHLDDTVYLRGMKGYSFNRTYFTVAVAVKAGKVLWTHQDSEPSISNIIEQGGRVYFATPSNLVCLDKGSGKERFSNLASRTGKDFPASIIAYKDRIVFISEMIVAAYHPVNGKQVFRHGFTPVSNEAGIDGLGKYIRKIQGRMGSPGSRSYATGSLSYSYGWQSRIYQDQANANWRRYRMKSMEARRTSGVTSETAYWDSLKASNQAKIDSAFSAAFAQLSFHMAMWQLESSANALIRQAANQLRLERLNFIRRSILSAYSSAQLTNYVYRPSEEEGVIGVSVVNLRTGKMTFTPLSPQKEIFGLWNVIDPVKGVVYHQGLRRVGKIDGLEFQNFFMSTRISLPR